MRWYRDDFSSGGFCHKDREPFAKLSRSELNDGYRDNQRPPENAKVSFGPDCIINDGDTGKGNDKNVQPRNGTQSHRNHQKQI